MKEFVAYIQPADAAGNKVGKAVSLNDSARGILYASANGLESKGKIKNVYTEEYPEADGVRVLHPADIGEEPTRAATNVELGVIFTGDARRDNYQAIYDVLKNSRVYFWDSWREKLALLVMVDATEPDEDVIKGNCYVRVTFKMQNIWGYAKNVGSDAISTYINK